MLEMEAVIRTCRHFREVYEKSWENFVYWCCTRGTDPIRAPLTEILAFLQSLMNSGFAYRTIGVYLSAISKFQVGIEGVPTGQHARVYQSL